VPQHRPPLSAQLRLTFEPDWNQPPKAPPSAALLQALAELLLAAMGPTSVSADSEEADDERQDRR
jgi:hypothetical protein